MTADQIKTRILEAFQGAQVQVTDLTGTQDHYEVMILAQDFKGLTRITRHRKVMSIFDPELKTGELHAFTIKAYTPEEAQAQTGME